MRYLRIGLTMLVALLGGVQASGSLRLSPPAIRPLVPCYFIENAPSEKSGRRLVEKGEVTAFIQLPGGRVCFTPDGAYFGLIEPSPGEPRVNSLERHVLESPISCGSSKTVVLKAGFQSTRHHKNQTRLRLEDPTGGQVHFLVGPQDRWRRHLPLYRSLVYEEVWPGVSVTYSAFPGHLECRLSLQPGADLRQIVMETSVPQLVEDAPNSLRASLSNTTLFIEGPAARQPSAGGWKELRAKILPAKAGQFRFEVLGAEDARTLEISFSLRYSSFFVGMSGQGIDVNLEGQVYTVGSSSSPDCPVTPGVWDTTPNGQTDVVASLFAADGSDLVFSTFLGGSGSEWGHEVKINSEGEIYLAGTTESADFPTTEGAWDRIKDGSDGDFFAAKLSPDGSDLLLSTLIGGSFSDVLVDMTLDSSGVVYVTGISYVGGFPTTAGAFDTTYNGSNDCVMVKLASDFASLAYSSYLGGSVSDDVRGVSIDGEGRAHVTGFTASSDFPVTPGSLDVSHNGANDVFVTKFSADGSSLEYSTFLGGGSDDYAAGIVVDDLDQPIIVGHTASAGFPVSNGCWDASFGGFTDIIVTKLNEFGSAIVFSTLIGGYTEDVGLAIESWSTERIIVVGYTRSNDFPMTMSCIDNTYNGSADMVLAILDSAGEQLLYSTYYGGAGNDYGLSVVSDEEGDVFIGGYTYSPDFPTTPGAFQPGWPDGIVGCGFVIKLGLLGSGDLNQDLTTDSTDAVILANYLCGNIAAGEGGFSAPVREADLDGDGVIVASDLVSLLQEL